VWEKISEEFFCVRPVPTEEASSSIVDEKLLGLSRSDAASLGLAGEHTLK
jgi:hypothetical protein